MSRWGRSRKSSLHIHMVCNTPELFYIPLKIICSFVCEGDHIFGLLPLLASRLNGAGGMVDSIDDPRIHESKDQNVSELRRKAFSTC